MSAMFGKEIREQEFMLRQKSVFLNHGSYGTMARCVYDAQRRLQEETEAHPDEWFRLTNTLYWQSSLRSAAEFVHARPKNLVFVENATAGMNCILRSIVFEKGDVILIHPATYAAVGNACRYVCDTFGAVLRYVDVKFPINSKNTILDVYKETLDNTPKVKLVVTDHISSQTAVLFPLKEIVKLCKSRGVLVAVDGAHAPGQVNLNLEGLGADFYTGNFHKWLFAPRGCAVLWVDPKHHAIMRGPVTSHFYKDPIFQYDFYLQGARDDTPYHASVRAIQFYKELGGYQTIFAYNTDLLERGVNHLISVWGTAAAPVAPECRAPFMRLVVCPDMAGYEKSPIGAAALMRDLQEKDDVQTASSFLDGELWFRISIQVYNTFEDFVRLGEAVMVRSRVDKNEVDLDESVFDFPKNTRKLII